MTRRSGECRAGRGGSRGGTVVAIGTSVEIAMTEESYTGQFLKKMLDM